MFIPHNTKTINLAYKSKCNRKGENQLVLLMITDGEKWHYTALGSVRTADGFSRPIRSWSRLFRGITGNNHGDFYYLNCSHSFLTDNALKKLYTDLKLLPLKQKSCQNNPNESYTETEAMHEPWGYTLSLISSLDSKENKYSFYRGRDCIKFYSDLKELATKIINYEEKDMLPSADNEIKFYEEQKECHMYKKEFFMIKMKKKETKNILKN